MALDSDTKKTIVEHFRLHETDTGSVEVQVALLTQRIAGMTEHMKSHRRDYHSRTGLLKMVGKRRRLLDYLARTDLPAYRALILTLGIRR